jgi:hypothetical protein
MAHTFIQMLQQITALIVGGAIGIGFGMLQDYAKRSNEKRQAEGKLNNPLTVMPGSGGRVALLLLLLVAIQVVCPLLFAGGIQWWVSGGLAAGYGVMLYLQLQKRMNEGK